MKSKTNLGIANDRLCPSQMWCCSVILSEQIFFFRAEKIVESLTTQQRIAKFCCYVVRWCNMGLLESFFV